MNTLKKILCSQGMWLNMVVCLIVYCGIVPHVFAEDYIPELTSLNGRVPENDALAAIRAGRFRFLGIGGYASSVPGIDNENCIVDRGFVDIIPGTGDFLSSHENLDLLRAAKDYSYKFNAIIKREFHGPIPMNCIRK